MDTEEFNTELIVNIKPHGTVEPIIHYGIGSYTNTVRLDKEHDIVLSIDLKRGNHTFFIEFNNKTNDTPDMAVEIVNVSFEGMTFDRFKWSSYYYPNYPEPWASQQIEPLPKFYNSATYLGWNGRWELNFSVPIFTWIHHLESLGWLYIIDQETGLLKNSKN